MTIIRQLPLALLALLALSASTAALADDPNDPALQSPAARARDHAMTRQLNLDEIAMAQQRDAAYARGWRQKRRENADPAANTAHDYAQEMADYAANRARYERQMSQWQRAVSACRAGYYEACDQR